MSQSSNKIECRERLCIVALLPQGPFGALYLIVLPYVYQISILVDVKALHRGKETREGATDLRQGLNTPIKLHA